MADIFKRFKAQAKDMKKGHCHVAVLACGPM